jgi:outer membrane immunogenic protein
MKKVIVAAAFAALATTTSAWSADMAMKAPLPPAPIWSWSGCYVGANGGYGWNNGNSHYNDPNTTGDPINGLGPTTIPTPSGTRGSGGLGGVGAACNMRPSNGSMVSRAISIGDAFPGAKPPMDLPV